MGRKSAACLTGQVLILTTVFLLSCNNDRTTEMRNQADPLAAAEYVGRQSCIECHEMEHNLFLGSDHDLAMDPATPETVVGDFNDAEFTHFGVTSKFYKRDGLFYVYTEGPEGTMVEYPVSYTFGIRPLQQYLIEFPRGAYQCLPIAWDTRPAADGGQRWFHLYGDEQITYDDILHWTGPNQNWNYMCSECHSTNVRKNYDYKTKTYNTTYNEVDVSCESCHGPSSLHVDWARRVEEGASEDIYPDLGLVVRLKDTDQATWVFDPDSVNARRSVPRQSDELIQMCARCHSRRSVITEDYYHGGSLLQTHWPSLLDENLYFADGQILDEVYVYGSYLQSKMYTAGVVCKDCHEPHSGQVYVDGNALCYRCHLASEYGGRSHHFHDPADEGASCMECHMHERTYMVVDPRRDHSIRIPRPDLSEELGTPNSCNQCHTDKTVEWATAYLKEWYGQDLLDTKHYGESFWQGRRAWPQAVPELVRLAENTSNPPMVRATAISLLSNYNDPSVPALLARTFRDPDALIRYASLTVTENNLNQEILNQVMLCLKDSVKLVRIMAANVLSRQNTDEFPSSRQSEYESALKEYKESLMINTDHPGTHVNYGNLYLNEGDLSKAEASYKEAIEIEPELVTAYINLADLYRRQNRDAEGEQLLTSALEKYPELAPVNYALGLLKIRQGQQQVAIEYLEKAASLAPEVAHYSYVYGIGLNSMGRPEEAINFLEQSLERHPYDQEILYGLTTILIEQGQPDEALEYARKLVDFYPGNANYQQVLEYIR